VSAAQAPRESRWELIVSGGIAILAGAFLLVSPAVSLTLLIGALGIALIGAGLFAGIDAVIRRGQAWGWRLLVGALSLVAGVFVLIEPMMAGIISLITLYFCMAFILTALGIFEIYNGLKTPKSWGSFALGVFQLILVLLLLMNPVFGTALVIPMVGITTILLGVLLIAGAWWRPVWLVAD
jgi:uncharacterized membrane protein HdeD (DUF308 family)